MNKKGFKKSTGRMAVTYNNYRQGTLEKTFRKMEQEEYEQRKRESGMSLGPRERALEAYKVNLDINDAISVIDEFNSKIGKTVYTKDMVKAWIQEYENRNKSRDDDDDVR